MKRTTKKGRRIFENELISFFNDELGANVKRDPNSDAVDVSAEFPTAYGPLQVDWFDADHSVYTLADHSVYNLAGLFKGDSLPKFRAIGFGICATSKKMHIHLGGEWGPLQAARHFIAVLRSAGIEPLPLNTKDNANA